MNSTVDEMLEDKKPPAKDEFRIQLANQSFIQLMRTRDGRRFVWFLLGESGFTGQPFTGQRETTDFNCGNRNMGILLFQLIDQFCPETFSLMMKESKEDYDYDHGRNKPGSSSDSGGRPSSVGNSGGSDSLAIIAQPGSSI